MADAGTFTCTHGIAEPAADANPVAAAKSGALDASYGPTVAAPKRRPDDRTFGAPDGASDGEANAATEPTPNRQPHPSAIFESGSSTDTSAFASAVAASDRYALGVAHGGRSSDRRGDNGDVRPERV